MSARRDIHVTRGDDYSHVVVFDTVQTGYTFGASAGPVLTSALGTYPTGIVVFTPTTSGASVTLTLDETQTSSLGDGSLSWVFKRTIGTLTNTILKGSVNLD